MTWFRNLPMRTKLIVAFAIAAVTSKAVSAAAVAVAETWWSSAVVHVVGAVLVVVMSVAMARAIARPLGQAAAVLESVAAGGLTRRPDYESPDQIGRLAGAPNHAVVRTPGGLREN